MAVPVLEVPALVTEGVTTDLALPRWRGTLGSAVTLGAFRLLVGGLTQYLVSAASLKQHSSAYWLRCC